MRPKRFFFSPQPTPETINNYIISFYETLSKSVHVVNYNSKHFSRSLDFLRYLFSCDVMVLNWPEDVLHLRFGILQLFVSFFSLFLFKVKGGTIVWVCHNKDSHKKNYRTLSKISRSFFTRIANHIIVHSEDAIHHLDHVRYKVHFLNHPVYKKVDSTPVIQKSPDIDVLIWGNITPYKGLGEFISNYKKFGAAFKVLIVGKADKQYYEQLSEQAQGLNIEIKNVLITEEELNTYFKQSKIILLPYLNSDTFSSGALIHSLNSYKIVIGPAVGNFIDVNKWGACLTYKNDNGLFKNIEELLSNQNVYELKVKALAKGIDHYYYANSWETFIEKMLGVINSEPKQPVRHSVLNKLPGQSAAASHALTRNK